MGSPSRIGANMLDCDIIVSEFKLQLFYDVYFWTNTLQKDMNHFILTPPQLWVR